MLAIRAESQLVHGLAGGLTEHADAAVRLVVAHHPVIRNVGPDDVAAATDGRVGVETGDQEREVPGIGEDRVVDVDVLRADPLRVIQARRNRAEPVGVGGVPDHARVEADEAGVVALVVEEFSCCDVSNRFSFSSSSC